MPDIRLIKIPKPGDDEPKDTSRDAWATPAKKYESMVSHWGIKPLIDACAEAHNTKCPIFMTPQMDSLSVDWIAFAKERGVDPIFWMNPPYSHPLILKFCRKAYEESGRGATVLSLLPSQTGSKWFHEYVKPLPKIRRGDYDFPRGRVSFVPPPGVKPSSPMIENLEVLWLPPQEV